MGAVTWENGLSWNKDTDNIIFKSREEITLQPRLYLSSLPLCLSLRVYKNVKL